MPGEQFRVQGLVRQRAGRLLALANMDQHALTLAFEGGRRKIGLLQEQAQVFQRRPQRFPPAEAAQADHGKVPPHAGAELRAVPLEAAVEFVRVQSARAFVQQAGRERGQTLGLAVAGAAGVEGQAYIHHGQFARLYEIHGDARGQPPVLHGGRGRGGRSRAQQEQEAPPSAHVCRLPAPPAAARPPPPAAAAPVPPP